MSANKGILTFTDLYYGDPQSGSDAEPSVSKQTLDLYIPRSGDSAKERELVNYFSALSTSSGPRDTGYVVKNKNNNLKTSCTTVCRQVFLQANELKDCIAQSTVKTPEVNSIYTSTTSHGHQVSHLTDATRPTSGHRLSAPHVAKPTEVAPLLAEEHVARPISDKYVAGPLVNRLPVPETLVTNHNVTESHVANKHVAGPRVSRQHVAEPHVSRQHVAGPHVSSQHVAGPHVDNARPVVVFVHGGGWRRGDKQAWRHYLSRHDTNLAMALYMRLFRLYACVGERLACAGVACAVIAYPLPGRLPLHILLLELFTSFLMSTALLATPFILTMAVVKWLLCDIFVVFSLNADWRSCLALNLCVTQLVTWLAVATNRRNYQTSLSVLLIPLVAMVTSCTLLFTHILAMAAAVVMVMQGFLLSLRVRVEPVSLKRQLESVGASVRYVRQVARRTGALDARRVFLMGHSAGAHLVALLSAGAAGREVTSTSRIVHSSGTITDEDLSHARRSVGQIQGIISVSGVHDVNVLNKNIIFRYLYLHPRFGDARRRRGLKEINTKSTYFYESQHNYKTESPLHRVDKRVPPFLVLNAEHDSVLLEDGRKFVETLKKHGVAGEHHVIKGTNHFTIISRANISRLCIDFINELCREKCAF